MRIVMVRYKTHEAQADANVALVHAVFDELRARAPASFRYTTYRLPDGVSFVHLATMDTPDDNPLTNSPAFKAFQKDIKERCVEPPLLTEMTVVDSYVPAA